MSKHSKKRAAGGAAEEKKGKEVEMNDKGGVEMKVAREKTGRFAKGGGIQARRAGGEVKGEASEERMDRRARGGHVTLKRARGGGSPYSSAHGDTERGNNKDCGHPGAMN